RILGSNKFKYLYNGFVHPFLESKFSEFKKFGILHIPVNTFLNTIRLM
ncbi:hypothetical protein MHK_007149, partial [Candidatus Magnetomorum sp. HK-1]